MVNKKEEKLSGELGLWITSLLEEGNAIQGKGSDMVAVWWVMDLELFQYGFQWRHHPLPAWWLEKMTEHLSLLSIQGLGAGGFHGKQNIKYMDAFKPTKHTQQLQTDLTTLRYDEWSLAMTCNPVLNTVAETRDNNIRFLSWSMIHIDLRLHWDVAKRAPFNNPGS